jgi:molybdate transport system substrate-binding protein
MSAAIRQNVLPVLLCLPLVQLAEAAEVKVLSTGIFRGIFPALISQFERASGHKINLQIETPFALKEKLLNGLDTDVVIAVTPIMKDIEAGAKIIPESRVAIGEVYIAAVVRSGVSNPDLTTPDAVKHLIRSARSVAINDPKSGSNVGRFVLGLADRFAFDDELRSRLKMYPGGGDQVAKAVVNAEVDFGITISSEILSVKKAKIAGRLPPEMNQVIVAYGFLVPGTKQLEAGGAFLAFLRSPEAKSIMTSNGIEPK